MALLLQENLEFIFEMNYFFKFFLMRTIPDNPRDIVKKMRHFKVTFGLGGEKKRPNCHGSRTSFIHWPFEDTGKKRNKLKDINMRIDFSIF
jgi:hypothetical protein